HEHAAVALEQHGGDGTGHRQADRGAGTGVDDRVGTQAAPDVPVGHVAAVQDDGHLRAVRRDAVRVATAPLVRVDLPVQAAQDGYQTRAAAVRTGQAELAGAGRVPEV